MTPDVTSGATALVLPQRGAGSNGAAPRTIKPGFGGGGSGGLRTVVVVNDHACVNGGQAKVAVESALLLRQAGIEVVFFAPVGPVDPSLAANGIEAICLGEPDIFSDPSRLRAAVRGLWNRPAAANLRELCARYDPESTIIHCHGFAKALSPSIGPVLTTGRLPHVFTMHEYFLGCPNGGFYDHTADRICTKRALGLSCLLTRCDSRHSVHKAWRVVRQATLRSVAGLPGGLRDLIYISETQRRAIAPYLNSHTRLHHVANPVDTDLPPVRAAENDVFLFVGRLSPEKGGLLFARAVREAGVRGVVVGDGEQRAAMLKANPDLTITGWLPGAEVQDWIGRARCLVFPSLWYECQPLVPMEALARRVPVICGSWGAAHEAVADGETGLVVDQPSAECFGSAISALSDPTHPVFSRIWERRPVDCSGQRHLARLLEVYEDVLQTFSARRLATPGALSRPGRVTAGGAAGLADTTAPAGAR